MKFVPPGEEERRRAIGSLEGMPPALRTFIQLAHFEPIPPPSPNDWLANHAEPGQTFDDFRRSRPNRPDANRRAIYLQPLDDFPPAPAKLAFTWSGLENSTEITLVTVEFLPRDDESELVITHEGFTKSDVAQ